VATGSLTLGVGVFGFAPAVTTESGGRVVTGGTNAVVGEGATVARGVDVGVGAFGADALPLEVEGAGWAATGADLPEGGTGCGGFAVLEDPAGTATSAPAAVVSTVPEIVTSVVSPLGETVT